MPLTKDEFLKKMKQHYEELNDRWNSERSKLQDKTRNMSTEARQKLEAEWEELGRLRKNMKEKIIDLALAGRAAAQPELLPLLPADLLDELRWALVKRSRAEPSASVVTVSPARSRR